jgi:hypothetical protein
MAGVTIDLDRLAALDVAASDGPWLVEHGRIYAGRLPAPGDEPTVAVMKGGAEWLANADLIVALRNALPALIEHLRDMESHPNA